LDAHAGADAPMIVRDAGVARLARVNRSFTERIGYETQELAREPLLSWIHPEDRARFQAALDKGCGDLTCAHRSRNGEWVEFDWRVRRHDSRPVVFGLLHDPSRVDPKVTTVPVALPEGTMAEILSEMVLIIEDERPGMKCSVLLLDDEGKSVRVGAGPSLPAEYNAAVEGLLIGPGVGSCGTAAYWNELIVVEDIQNDPLWFDLRDHAAHAGVSSCWSHPIVSKSGKVLGAAALYNPTPRAPTQQEIDGLETAARMFSLAIERSQTEEALRRSEAEAKLQSRLLSEVTAAVTSFVDSGDWKAAGTQLVDAALDLTGSSYGFLGEVHGDELWVQAHLGVVWSVDSGQEFYEDAIKQYEQQGYLVFPNLDNLFGLVARTGEAVISDDVPGDERAAGRLPPGHPELRRFLGVPIVKAGEVVAMMGIANAEQPYSSEDLSSVEFLCQAGSVMFDSHRRSEHESALEEQLQQAAKMEALGVVVGGLAHDFNNVLATVLGNAELAMTTVPAGGETHELLHDIAAASRSANEFCNQMLAYAGRGVLTMQPLECNALIREFGALLNVTMSKKAHLHYELGEQPLYVEGDKAQLGQVLMNLITNAAEAFGEGSGEIVASIDAVHSDGSELHTLQPGASLAPGEYVRITVSDAGCGMDDETQQKIFDPFFTTKFTGRGLGLAAVRGIVLRHHGAIGLESQLGKGTKFTLLLPRTEGAERVLDPPAASVDGHGGKCVLVVDDEPQVRKVLGRILETEGFEVMRAADGREAVEIFEAQADLIDCVLLDLTMPELDGAETFRELKRIRGDVRVVLSSGFAEDDILNRFKGVGFAGVLQKPTPKDVLIAKIHEALG
jgi:signal transduction histidine kinase